MLARHLTIAGQYLGGQCGSSSGRVSIMLDRFPACFVSPAVSYPFARFPPRRPVPPHPVPIQSRLASFRLIRPIPLIASLSSPITPRLSCRRNGADFINASNSMPLKSGLRNDASLLLAYRHAGSMLTVGSSSSHHLIEYASLSLLTATPSHHGVGLRTEPPPQSLSPPIAPPIVSRDGETSPCLLAVAI